MKCQGTHCSAENASDTHSLECQFEHFCSANGLDDSTYVNVDGTFLRFIDDRTDIAWRAFTWRD